ncbi:MAG: hypothetical protein ABEI52_10635, partial [Halobacteriaceae archaeon]
TTSIYRERGEELAKRAAQLQARLDALNRTAANVSDALNRTRQLQARYDALNVSYARNRINQSTYESRVREIKLALRSLRQNTIQSLRAPPANLEASQAQQFGDLMRQVRGL